MDWVESYVQYTDNLEPSQQFRRWAAVGAVASALQRRCWALAGHRHLYPNMYIVLAGPSGCGKTTALEPALEMIQEAEIPLASDCSTRRAFMDKLMGAKKVYRHGETEVTHTSMTIFSAELAVFLGRENWEFMQELSNLYDCPNTWEYNTANCGDVLLEGVWLNILGAMTPKGVNEILLPTAAGGGIASRVIFVVESKLEKILIDPSLKTTMRGNLVDKLRSLSVLQGEFRRSKGFIRRAGEWYVESKKHPESNNPVWDGYYSRKRVHLLKLSMILNASRFDSGMTLTEADFERSLEILNEAEESMFKVFNACRPTKEIIQSLMRTIVTHKSIHIHELYGKHSHEVGRRELVDHLTALGKVSFCQVNEEGFVEYLAQKEGTNGQTMPTRPGTVRHQG